MTAYHRATGAFYLAANATAYPVTATVVAAIIAGSAVLSVATLTNAAVRGLTAR